VIRLAVPDVAHVGRVAGRVYAWSTVGAIVGTFAAGFVLVSQLGMYRTVIAAAALPGVAAVVVGSFWNRNALLYPLSLAFGGVLASLFVFHPATFGITRETNYYTIGVHKPTEEEIQGKHKYPPDALKLNLDHLMHSMVRPSDPTFLHYPHEQVQMEFLRRASAEHPDGPRVLVVGGGGYTFPRCARTLVPTSSVDVVEIDPGVTAVSYSHLGLDPGLNIASHHMDGRQFVAEKAPAGHYHLITLDAVNDLSVPAHLLTREFNEQVKRSLTPDGVYLLTVIDVPDGGRLWAAAVHTLRETFPHVVLLLSSEENRGKLKEQQVMVLYASTRPLDLDGLRAELARQKVTSPFTHPLPAADLDALLRRRRPLVLTDQFAPVDNLMAPVFRQREMK
jgi:spermidine synthase